MARIVMLLSNAFRPDPRVAREAESLARAGHEMIIICWDREDEFPVTTEERGYRVLRVQSVPTKYGAGAKQLFYTPRFWRVAVSTAEALLPDVVHCHDLDTLPAGWHLKRRTGARLVYDAHEDYPALMSLYLPNSMVRVLAWLERLLLRRVDLTITASTVLADRLLAQGLTPVTTIGNVQTLAPFDAVDDSAVKAARQRLGLAPDDLVVAYIGGFSRNRLLIPLIQAARKLPAVQVLLWGDGHQQGAVEQAVAGASNAQYLGWLAAEQVPLYTRMADVIYYCLVPDYPGAVYNAPNTLSNAMAAGRPIIANDVGDLGRIVRETGCGLLVPEVTPGAIGQAVQSLMEAGERRRLGQAGRTAAEIRYNWAVAEEQLLHVYNMLLGKR